MIRPISSVLVDFRQPGPAPSVSPPVFEFGDVSLPEGDSGDDHEELVQQAEDRGLEQGRAEAAAKYEEALAIAQASVEEQVEARLSAAREQWVEAEGARIADRLDSALTQLQDLIAGKTAAVLNELVQPALRDKVLAELLQIIETLTRQDQAMIMRIEGPGDLLESIRKNLAGRVRSLDLVETEATDVRIIAQDTVIESHLGHWLSQVVGETEA